MKSASSNGSAVLSQRISYEEYLKSDNWLNLRSTALAKAGGKCEVCKRKSNLHGHHLKYRNLFDCTVDDIMSLCSKCHETWHLFHSARSESSRDFVLGFLSAFNSRPKTLPPQKVSDGSRKRMDSTHNLRLVTDTEVIMHAKSMLYRDFKSWVKAHFKGKRVFYTTDDILNAYQTLHHN